MAKRTVSEEDLAKAELLGREAFANGKPCVPALSLRSLEPLLRSNCFFGSSVPIMSAWSSGWAKACLAVPVKGCVDFVSVWE